MNVGTKKFSIKYTGRFTNSIRTNDKHLFKAGISAWKHDMTHNIPVSATFTLFNYLQISPSVNYTERWYTRKVNKSIQSGKTQTGSNCQRLNQRILQGLRLFGKYQPQHPFIWYV